MAPGEPTINTEKVITPSVSSSAPESPMADSKPKSTRSSSDYGSDSTESAVNDGISMHIYDENEDLGHELGKSTSKVGAQSLTRYATGISVATTTNPNFELDLADNDPADTHNLPLSYRGACIFFISFSTLTVYVSTLRQISFIYHHPLFLSYLQQIFTTTCPLRIAGMPFTAANRTYSVMYSTSYTSGIPGIMSDFNISNEAIAVLGITTYMIGLALGSVVLAPLSEMYGRRPIYLVAMAMFCVLTIPCALATNLEAILITRFFGAIAGSAMISNAPGTVNDVVLEEHRAMAFSIWSIGPMNGVSVGKSLLENSGVLTLLSP